MEYNRRYPNSDTADGLNVHDIEDGRIYKITTIKKVRAEQIKEEGFNCICELFQY